MKHFALILVGALTATMAFADETFKFECMASTITPEGQFSKVWLSQDGASVDGQFFEASEVQASTQQDVTNTANKYVNGKQAKVLLASIDGGILKSEYDGYPNDDANHIISRIYMVEITAQTTVQQSLKYFGTCSQTYSGD